MKLLTFCCTMAQSIDLDRLSRDELMELAYRIEDRIRVLSDDTAGRMAGNSDARSPPATDAADPRSAPHATAPEVNPGTRATLSEKVQ